MLMSRRYWSSEPSSNDDFLLFGVVAIRAIPGDGGPAARDAGRGKAGTTGVVGRAISMHALAEPRPANVGQPGELGGGVGRVAEVDDLRTPTQQRGGDEPPIPAVERVVPIVAQHEVLLLRDDQRPPVVSRWMVADRGVRGAHQEVALPPKLVPHGVGLGVGMR